MMNTSRHMTAALILLIAGLLVGTAGAAPIRVLLLSGANNHDWKTTTPELQRIYAESGRFTVDVAEDPASLTPEQLAPYDVVVSNWTNYPSKERILGETAERALLGWVRAGHGFALFHAASAIFPGWEEWHRLAGASWAENVTGHGAYHRFRVRVSDPDHPVTRGVADFDITDELWHRVDIPPTAHVLCTAFSALETGGTGQNEPVALASRFGAGRSFNLILGHDAAAMDYDGWRLLMLRGTEWAATDRVTITRPLDPDAVLAEVASYDAKGPRDRVAVVERLVRTAEVDESLRADVAAKMVAMLEGDATDDCKEFLLRQLSLIAGPAQVPAAARLIDHPRFGIHAVNVLRRVDDGPARAALRLAMPHLRGVPLAGVIIALGQMRYGEAVYAIADRLGSGDRAVAMAAVRALAEIGGVEAAEALARHLATAPEGQRATTCDALLRCAEGLGPGDAERVYRRLWTSELAPEVRRAALAGLALLTTGTERVESIVAAFRTGDQPLCGVAARAVVQAKDATLTSAVAECLPGLPPAAQVEGLGALSAIGRLPSCTRALLASDDPQVCRCAARALGRLGSAGDAPAIIAALRSAPDAVRSELEAALTAVWRRGGVAPVDVDAIAHEPEPARSSLMRAVAALGSREGFDVMSALVQQSSADVRAVAFGALAGWPWDDPVGAARAMRLAVRHLDEPDAAAAAVSIAQGLGPEHKEAVTAAMNRVLTVVRTGPTRTAARQVLMDIGAEVAVTKTTPLTDAGPNLAIGAVADSPDGIDSDGAASGDQAAIDGDPNTYWDEVNDQTLYILRVTFAAPTEVSAIRITGHAQFSYDPRDFEIVCDGVVVKTIEDAWYESNQFATTFRVTRCKTLELRITGWYGQSPGIRELEIFNPPVR